MILKLKVLTWFAVSINRRTMVREIVHKQRSVSHDTLTAEQSCIVGSLYSKMADENRRGVCALFSSFEEYMKEDQDIREVVSARKCDNSSHLPLL